MSVIWTEEDDKKLEAMKYLEEQGHSARIVGPDGKNVEMLFDIIDSWKASSFLGDLLYHEELQEITGIKVNVIGYPHKAGAAQIRDHVTAITQLLNELEQ